ncbi:hypothetical protein V6N12_050802 [Hibiscus sabdariffa]|uniref:Uncharacterized protein n=1 Tax=Hibiscus sabdariffa TaxID=183260 RepID=A0ABR2GDH4_9ROSI
MFPRHLRGPMKEQRVNNGIDRFAFVFTAYYKVRDGLFPSTLGTLVMQWQKKILLNGDFLFGRSLMVGFSSRSSSSIFST